MQKCIPAHNNFSLNEKENTTLLYFAANSLGLIFYYVIYTAAVLIKEVGMRQKCHKVFKEITHAKWRWKMFDVHFLVMLFITAAV